MTTDNWRDGRNVVLHEFAHQLDQQDGKAEGVPILQRNSDYFIWANVMTEAYQQLCNDVLQGVKTVMDSYGATNPAEFFATEIFSEIKMGVVYLIENLLESGFTFGMNFHSVDPTQLMFCQIHFDGLVV